MSRVLIIPLAAARAVIIPLVVARAFVTSIVAPSGGPPPDTFHILTELGDVIDTEAGDQTRTE